MKDRKANPAAITIFGAKGDLTHRKLIPALYNLFIAGHLPSVFAIFCVDFLDVREEEYKKDLLGGVDEFSRTGKAEEKKWKEFADRLNYIPGDFLKTDTFLRLREKTGCFR